MSTNVSDNSSQARRQIVHNEETVQSGQPERTTVSQTQSTTTDPTASATRPVSMPAAAEPPVSAKQSTVQTTSTSTAPTDQYVSRSVSDNVVDPAADKAATVAWVSRAVWLVVGLMVALIAIRFVLLAVGANENAGFAQLIYGLTDWMVAPFAALFGSNLTYPGAAGTGSVEAASLAAIVVYALIGLLVTKVAQLMLGTNRTTGTVYSETKHQTKL
jgi:uncharacterized protein YggT (Ycf19 family)